MTKEMIISGSALETKVAILEDDQLAELYIERNRRRSILANTYKGKVTKVLPGMQSAFVNIGLEKDAFLYVSDFFEDTEECDKVYSAAEEQVATAMAEAEDYEYPHRRERKTERGRWKERRERAEAARPALSRTSQTQSIPSDSWEHWDISAETERETASRLESDELFSLAAIPEIPKTPVPAQPAGAEDESASRDSSFGFGQEMKSPGRGVEPAPAELEKLSEASPGDSASIRDDGDQLAFSMDQEDSKASFARRRAAATRRKRYTAARYTPRPDRQSIGDMLHEGQEILVQVAKEPIGKKGARVTSYIALPGRYLVYMPTVEHVGVSRKIGSEAERIRLKDIILKHRDRFPGGVIVRTAAKDHSEEDLVKDLEFLLRIWEDMRARAEEVSAPALIHAEMNLVQRLLRDQLSFEFAAIRVDDEMEYQRVVEIVDKIYPNLVHRVKLYTKDIPIFDEYGITSEIDKLLQSKIWLKSGGYIVINQTEALVSIDINTGKFVGRGNSLEETITRTNIEAVKEIVRQIRLRDLGGIIVIDFIDMDERKNRKRVMEALSEEIARDKAPRVRIGGNHAEKGKTVSGPDSLPALPLLLGLGNGEIGRHDLLQHLS